MELKEVTNKEEWEGFFLQCAEKTFLQSWNWGEFNERMGNKIWRFGVLNPSTGSGQAKERFVAVALVIRISAKRGTFLFIPHGPVFIDGLAEKDRKEILELILVQLSSFSKEEKASFIRISPLLERTQENKNIFIDLGFRDSPMHASTYEATWKLDIYPSEEELLTNMRKTTRYLIKKTEENKNISIEKSVNPGDIGIYQKLSKEVSKRQKFVGFSQDFIRNEFEVFAQDKEIVFLFGKCKEKVAAGAMVIFWSGIGFYHQAASLGEFSKLSIPYLLQWEAIKEAKNRGCKIYDFWGFTDPEKFPKHPWAGPTLFKMGFGGYKKEYIETQDFVLSKKYWINYIIEKARKAYRGL